MYVRERRKFVSVSEMNELLKIVSKQCPHIYYHKKEKGVPFQRDAYIEVKRSSVTLSFCKGLKASSYICNLDDSISKKQVDGQEVYRCLRHYYKEDVIENADEIGSAKQLIYKNEAYDGKRVKAYAYDMNSAFSYFMMQDIPDVTTLRTNSYIKDGEVGFVERADGELKAIFEKGYFCSYVMKLMLAPEGYKRFIEHWYSIKQKAREDGDKKLEYKAKNYLNFCIGYYQKTNPFIRCCIVSRNNQFIKSLIDENTIYANTDSIVSTIRRYDIEEMCGTEIGKFKKEHFGEDFAWQKGKVNYQWNLESPSMRGVPKAWFKGFEKKMGRKWDILLDDIPTACNPYYYDEKTNRIVRTK